MTTPTLICDIPADVIAAAIKVKTYMDINHYRYWQLGGVCDRRFAYQVEFLSQEVAKKALKINVPYTFNDR